jgi:hypothetical protein
MRSVNTKKLRELVEAQGERAKAKVSVGAKVGLSTLDKLIYGTYPNEPGEAIQMRLSEFFNVTRDELFPLVRAKRHRAS